MDRFLKSSANSFILYIRTSTISPLNVQTAYCFLSVIFGNTSSRHLNQTHSLKKVVNVPLNQAIVRHLTITVV